MKDGLLKNRYTVVSKDGKPIPEDKQFFVIEIYPSPDIRELAALNAYIKMAQKTGYIQLAESLQSVMMDSIDSATDNQKEQWLEDLV